MKRNIGLIFAAALSLTTLAYAQDKRAEGNASPSITSSAATSLATPPTAPVASPDADCGCETQPLPETLAEVGGVKIATKEIEDSIKDSINGLKQEIREARQHELYLQINTRLLEAEAKRRGKSTSALVDEEIVGKVKEPTEVEAQSFYNNNRERIRQEFPAVRQQIMDYLRNERQREEAKKFAERLRASSAIVIIKQENDASINGTLEPSRVLATVDGQPLTAGAVEENIRPLVFKLQTDIYRLRKQRLDVRINDLLLQREAETRKVTTAALLEAEVAAKIKKVTEEEARAFFEENRGEIGGDFLSQKDRVMAYLQEREARRAEINFAARLRQSGSTRLFLKEPEQPVYRVATDNRPAKGPASAPVTVVAFMDFQCDVCASSFKLLQKALGEYEGQMRLVVRDFPAQLQTDSFKAAEAAEAAREQGKYWEYVELLMRDHTRFDAEQFKAYASQLSLDRKRFDEALDSGKHAEVVERDLRDGFKYGLTVAPAIFVNGRLIADLTYENLKAAIDVEIKERKVSRK